MGVALTLGVGRGDEVSCGVAPIPCPARSGVSPPLPVIQMPLARAPLGRFQRTTLGCRETLLRRREPQESDADQHGDRARGATRSRRRRGAELRRSLISIGPETVTLSNSGMLRRPLNAPPEL